MQNSTTSSFWASPAMQAKMAQHRARMAVAEAQLETSPPIQDQDLRSNNFKDLRSIQDPIFEPVSTANPDGLDSLIKGKYAELLKNDPDYLLARSWGVHPANLTDATKRFSADWVKKQVQFVKSNSKVSNKRAYLAKILRSNQY